MCQLSKLLAGFAAGMVCLPAWALEPGDTSPIHEQEVKAQHEVAIPLVEENSEAEVMWEFDPYYSDVAANIPLTHKPVPTIRSNSELKILRDLIEGSLIPRYMLLEASIYPMPLLGTYLKSRHNRFYRSGEFGQSGINVIESATAGFQEPWAVSAFFGNIAKLVRPGDKRVGSNVGYTGYLLSAGSKHIKSNTLIDDHWLEVEWKIKGKLDYPDEKLGWSFRVGGKFHDHPDIADVLYISLYRSNLNARLPLLEWLNNSNFNLKTHINGQGQLVRQEFVVGKKFPAMHWNGFVPTVDIGFIWASPREYQGRLRAIDQSMLTLVLRPSVEF